MFERMPAPHDPDALHLLDALPRAIALLVAASLPATPRVTDEHPSVYTDREFPRCWDCDSELLNSGECPTCDYRGNDDARVPSNEAIEAAAALVHINLTSKPKEADVSRFCYVCGTPCTAETCSADCKDILETADDMAAMHRGDEPLGGGGDADGPDPETCTVCCSDPCRCDGPDGPACDGSCYPLDCTCPTSTPDPEVNAMPESTPRECGACWEEACTSQACSDWRRRVTFDFRLCEVCSDGRRSHLGRNAPLCSDCQRIVANDPSPSIAEQADAAIRAEEFSACFATQEEQDAFELQPSHVVYFATLRSHALGGQRAVDALRASVRMAPHSSLLAYYDVSVSRHHRNWLLSYLLSEPYPMILVLPTGATVRVTESMADALDTQARESNLRRIDS
jgi:hypothetical protein